MNKRQILLAIDTSTATMAGAIVQDGKKLAEVQTEAERNHSIHIMTNIEAMLATAELSVNDVTAFVTGVGPGSYTGVRISVTAAKTLAWVDEKPVIGVSSLEALAYGAVLIEQSILTKAAVLVVPIMDARRGQVYTASFAHDELQSWQRNDQDQILMMDEWCKQLADRLESQSTVHSNAPITQVWFVGDVQLHESSIEAFTEIVERNAVSVRKLQHAMLGEAIARLGEWKLTTMDTQTADLVHKIVPNYAQLTEAEVKQNAKDKKEGQA